MKSLYWPYCSYISYFQLIFVPCFAKHLPREKKKHTKNISKNRSLPQRARAQFMNKPG